MRDWKEDAVAKIHTVVHIQSLPMRDWKALTSPSKEGPIEFKAYLWGIERRCARSISIPCSKFKAYLWGIERSLNFVYNPRQWLFKAYLWGIERLCSTSHDYLCGLIQSLPMRDWKTLCANCLLGQCFIQSLPMRDWKIEFTVWEMCHIFYSKPTYEGLKAFILASRISALSLIQSLPMRDWKIWR